MALSDKKIQTAKVLNKKYKLFDGKGLYILVSPSGSKLWRLKYHFAGKERLISLGSYPELTLEKAREKHFEARKLITAGIDPGAQKQIEKQEAIIAAKNTFQAIALEWHETNTPRWDSRHAKRILARMQNHLFPQFGHKPVDSFKPLDILDVLKKIESEGKHETVHRLLNYTQCVFRYAVITGRILNNPARELGAAIKPKQTNHFPTIHTSELNAFLTAFDTVSASLRSKLAFKLQLLTFLRTNELRQLKWSYIDARLKELRIPAIVMKMKLPHVVPLSREAIEVLIELEKLSGDDEYIFPNIPGKKCPYMSENTVNQVIVKMGYKGRIVSHGFRSLASTTLNEAGFHEDAIERQLGHKEPNKVRAAYNHAEYLNERRAIMDWWGAFIRTKGKIQNTPSQASTADKQKYSLQMAL